MKKNKRHKWTIRLIGKTRSESVLFTGTVEEALAKADEKETEVSFDVHQFVITRGRLPRGPLG